jgi:hypothetical protein
VKSLEKTGTCHGWHLLFIMAARWLCLYLKSEKPASRLSFYVLAVLSWYCYGVALA